ncbi:HEAT repeat domain-containing protein [Paenibacillus ginsengihumi]|uniref:HEAT repeat domain-containing protein n=1 Tax=Paenibacillus ginsengihumi TaxID=431596 RepID=UPI00035F35B5|nr:HEAT repeat domain-containing protein [Paenibacillus ginsengihumi]
MPSTMDELTPVVAVLGVLSAMTAGGIALLLALRARHARTAAERARSLSRLRDYFAYLSASIDRPEPLQKPPGPLQPGELAAIRGKLLEWIETIGGPQRRKLTELCRELGLVEAEKRRLGSSQHGVRIDAAYHLGVMRAADGFEPLLALFERERDSTSFVVARAAAKCARNADELHRLAEQLVRTHPASLQLIADILASSSLDLIPFYAKLLESENEALTALALTGLSGSRYIPAAYPRLEKLLASGHKEVRIKASKLLLAAPHLLSSARLTQLMRHPDWQIRAMAAKAAGELMRPHFLGELRQGLKDDSWWVRHYSARGLSRLGPDGFLLLCEAAADGENVLAAEIAREAARQELDRSAAAAARELPHAAHFNRLSRIYQSVLGEVYAPASAEPPAQPDIDRRRTG